MTVIPDSIEPIEEWRTWRFDGKELLSHNRTRWVPGEPHKAMCMYDHDKEWRFVRSGMSLANARAFANDYNERERSFSAFSSSYNSLIPTFVSLPSVEPPPGFGYSLETIRHDAPSADCMCGIYAGRTPADCPGGDVLGKVKLWGTIVPGTKGSRAEYAYPSEFHVPAKLADHPALLAYGVPIVTVAEKDLPPVVRFEPRTGMPWSLRIAVAVNFAAMALNLGVLFIRELA